MLASKPKEVLNLYEWLPPYGETSVSFRMPEAHLEVDVFYDYRSEGPTQLRKKTLIFTQVCFFMVSSSPGVLMSRSDCEGPAADGSLMEFTDSEPARLWQRHFGGNRNRIRHFCLFFLAENRRLEVLAEDCRLVDGSMDGGPKGVRP